MSLICQSVWFKQVNEVLTPIWLTLFLSFHLCKNTLTLFRVVIDLHNSIIRSDRCVQKFIQGERFSFAGIKAEVRTPTL